MTNDFIFFIKRLLNFLYRKNPLKLNSFRAKPEFLIIGAMKAGTTYAFNLLRQHPDLRLPKEKEIDFFDINYVEGVNWYKYQFPFNFRKNKKTGEATPYYLYHPLAAERAYKFNPNFKIIIFLRNPVNRSISHYNFIKNMKNMVPFSDILGIGDLEISNQELIEKDLINGKIKSSLIHRNFSFLRRSLYLYQIERWEKHFKKENFIFIKSEEFYKNPLKEINRVFNFIGVKELDYLDLSVYKHETKNNEKLQPYISSYLKEYYKQSNYDLEKHLNVKFNWN
ncbi:MAG: sulfotransferase domain-containing protein [Saprospiraceae bacterium]